MAWFVVLIAAFISCAGNLLIKKARLDFAVVESGAELDYFFNLTTIAGLSCFGLGFIIFSFALKSLPVSQAYPVLSSLSFVLLSLSAHYFLGEGLGFAKYIGMSFIAVGIFFMID